MLISKKINDAINKGSFTIIQRSLPASDLGADQLRPLGREHALCFFPLPS